MINNNPSFRRYAMSEKNEMSKRDIVIAEIEKGGATMDSLCTAADCKYASVMSIFSMLRLMGKCPVKDVPVKTEDGNEEMTYRFVTPEEWEKMKEEKAANAKTRTTSSRTPYDVLQAAEKKVERTEKASQLADERAKKDEADPVLALKAQIASLNYDLAKIELKEATKAFKKAKKAGEPTGEPEDTQAA
jgi:hypothetical protein